MKRTKEQIKRSYDYLQQYRGKQIAAIINRVSRSGMSRKIEFYAGDFDRIGYHIANIVDYPYNVDKGGLTVSGCGMDMIFSVLSNFNYAMAKLDTGKTITELLESKECGEHIYDTYFINANNYKLL